MFFFFWESLEHLEPLKYLEELEYLEDLADFVFLYVWEHLEYCFFFEQFTIFEKNCEYLDFSDIF